MNRYTLNETHDTALTSWVSSANEKGTDFPIQNLPFAEFRRSGSDEAFRGGVAIGDQLLDLAAVNASGVMNDACRQQLLACSESPESFYVDGF